MDELPNAVSYVVFVAIIISFASVLITWGPMKGITSFSVVDIEKNTCTQQQCDVFDVKYCQERDLRRVNYDCIDGKCRLVADEIITKCNFDCEEPDKGEAKCQIAINR